MNTKAMLTIVLTAWAMGASAQVKPAITKKEKLTKETATEAVKPAPIKAIKPTGPTGFGPIKFKMSKEELEALSSADDVHLEQPLTVKEMKSVTLKDGTVWYEGRLKMSQAATPVKSTFVFEDNKMTYFSMELHEITWESMQRQIAEKYGTGEVKDHQKEEQCIYKNGSSFKLLNGIKSVSWRQITSPNEQVITSASDMQFAMCPVSLRDSIFSSKTNSISFSLEPIKREAPKSLF